MVIGSKIFVVVVVWQFVAQLMKKGMEDRAVAQGVSALSNINTIQPVHQGLEQFRKPSTLPHFELCNLRSRLQWKFGIKTLQPPPPTTRSGFPKLFINSTHLPWPLLQEEVSKGRNWTSVIHYMDRLNVPSLSPTRESAPHCRKTAPGCEVV